MMNEKEALKILKKLEKMEGKLILFEHFLDIGNLDKKEGKEIINKLESEGKIFSIKKGYAYSFPEKRERQEIEYFECPGCDAILSVIQIGKLRKGYLQAPSICTCRYNKEFRRLTEKELKEKLSPKQFSKISFSNFKG